MTKMPIERVRALPSSMRLNALAAAMLTLAPLQAMAEVNFHAGASATGEYDDNLFRIPSGVTPPGGTDAPRSDRIGIAGADADLEGKFGDQRLYVQGKGQRFYYKNYDDLDHNEYDGKGGLDWKGGDLFDGTLSY